MEVAQYMERFYSQNDRYDKVNDNSGTDVSIPSALTTVPRGGSSGSTYYTIGFQDETLTPRGFTLEAVPTGAQANDRCGTLRLSSVGQRTKDGGSDDMSAADCWR
ncbi:MAG: type IV pilin protein [Ottowia sp.]|nr:type IV pilin protein [Ottowia sp.]